MHLLDLHATYDEPCSGHCLAHLQSRILIVLVVGVALHEVSDVDDAVLVPLDLLLDVVGLQLCQNLNHRLLQSRLRHQSLVSRSCEPLLPNFDSLNGSHPIPDFVVGSGHELPSIGCQMSRLLGLVAFKNEDVAFLPKLDLVQNFNTRCSGVQIVMEVAHVFMCHPAQFSDFKNVCDCSFKCHFHSVVHFHEDDVNDVNYYKSIDRVVFYHISS